MPKAVEAAVEYQALTTRDETGGTSTKIFGIALAGVFAAMLLLNALAMNNSP
jgi:tetrahydromethanopterin S-methyltransferase subunit F